MDLLNLNNEILTFSQYKIIHTKIVGGKIMPYYT